MAWVVTIRHPRECPIAFLHKAVPGADGPGPSLDGPIGELRFSRTTLAELLRLRLTSAMGDDRDGPGDMLRFC